MELRVGTQDMVENTQMGIAQLLRCLNEVAQSGEISSELGDWDVDANVHAYPPFDNLRGEATVKL
jgi:hypothetical protein